MPKTIQGLKRREGNISFARSGSKMDDFSDVRIGDVANVFHKDGGTAAIRVDAFNGPKEDGTFIGTVVQSDGRIPGVQTGDNVIENLDFVFVVVRSDNEMAKAYQS